jgi:hypothetical protein
MVVDKSADQTAGVCSAIGPDTHFDGGRIAGKYIFVIL